MNTTYRWRMMWMGVIAAVAVLLAGGEAWAQTFIVDTGDWTNSASWSGGVPTLGSGNVNIGNATKPVSTAYIHSVDAAFARNIILGGAAGQKGALIIEGGTLSIAGVSGATTLGNAAGATGIVVQSGGVVTNGGSQQISIGGGNGGYGSLTISGGVWTNGAITATPLVLCSAAGTSYGELIVSGGRYFCTTSAAAGTRVANQASSSALISISNGGRFESAGGIQANANGGNRAEIRITDGGIMVISNTFSLAASVAGSTGLLYIASGGVFSNQSTSANTLGLASGDVACSIIVSNGVFDVLGNVSIANTPTLYPAASVELFGTQRVFRTGASAVLTVGASGASGRIGVITNHVQKYSGGVEILNTGAGLVVNNTGSKIRIMFEADPVGTGDFWGLRWAGNNHSNALQTLVTSGNLSWDDSALSPSYQGVGIYTNSTDTFVGKYETVVANVAPVVTNPANRLVTINMTEDDLSTWTPQTIYARDADGNILTWTNGLLWPANGTVDVINVTASNLASYTYRPYTNFNGTNTFTVKVFDALASDVCTVQVAVAAVNDPPTNSAAPTVTSPAFLYSDTWTALNGTWSDNVDTNASYSGSLSFAYQWQYSNGVSYVDFLNETNSTFTPPGASWVGTNVRVRVTCTDSGYPGTASNSAVSIWYPVLGATILAPVITNAGPLSTTVLEDAASTDLQAVFSLLATNITEAGTLTWGVAVAPTQGTAVVSGGAAVSSSPTTFTYQPSANRNGGDTFVLTVSNAVGGLTSNITVNIAITAVNDAPVCTATGTVSGTFQAGNTLSFSSGTWNDGADTNPPMNGVSALTLTQQWQRADNGSGLNASNITGQTALTYLLSVADVQKYVRVQEVCTDTGAPGPGLSVTNSTAWTYVERAPLSFTNVAAGRFNSTNTWTPNTDYPRLPGDIANITSLNVTNLADSEVTNGVTVNLSGGGTLWCATAASPVHSNATLNVSAGGTLRLNAGVAVVCTNINLNGGTLAFSGSPSIAAGSVLRVNSDSYITPISASQVQIGAMVHGTGKLTLTADENFGGTACAFASGSTWTGAWDVEGNIRMKGANSTWSMPGDVRVTAGKDMRFDGSGPHTFKGTRFGGGTNSAYQNCVFRVGDGTGNGMMSPGDAVVSNGVGSVAVITYSTPSFNATLQFNTNSTFAADIRGGTSGLYDTVSVSGSGAGTGIVQILSGAKLDVTLWRAPVNTNIGVTILDLPPGAQGALSGGFVVTWHTTNGWSNLAVYTNGSDLCVTGDYTVVNASPVISPVGPVVTNMNEDGGTLSLTNLGLTATDADGDSLMWTNVNQPANGTVAVNGSGTNPVSWTAFTYTPTTPNYNGTNAFEVKAYDPYGGAATVTVQVVVNPLNDAPVCTTAPTVSGLFQGGQIVTSDAGVWNDAADTNVSGSSSFAFTWQWRRADDGAGANAANILNATNAAYTLTASETGKYVCVQVTCTDDGVGTPAAQSTITNSTWTLVTEANSLPVITNGAGPLIVTLTEDCGATDLQAVLNLGATDADPGQQATLAWTNWTVPANGTVTVNGTGPSPATVLYTPASNFNGTNTFTVRVTDTPGGYAEVTVEVHVTAVNDAPTNTVAPSFSGIRLVGNMLTASPGTWNDAADTNVSGSSTMAFTYQWRRADDSGGSVNLTNLLSQTNATYTLTSPADKYRWFSVEVTCTDSGVGSGGAQSSTVYSAWLQETSSLPTVVVFNKSASDWGTITNWTPNDLPSASISAAIGDTTVQSLAAATIGLGDAVAAKNLYLGTNANASGTLSMTGGTLTFPAGATVTVASAASSTGVLTQTGGAIQGFTSGQLTIASGTNSTGSLYLSGSSVVTALMAVATAPGAQGTLIISNAWMRNNAGNNNTAIGNASNAIGRVRVCGTGWLDLNGRPLNLGLASFSTGILEVTDSGVVTNMDNVPFVVGAAGGGVGQLTVSGNGRFVAGTPGILLGGTNTSSSITVAGGGVFNAGGATRIAHAVGAVGMLTVTNSGTFLGGTTAEALQVGATNNSLGQVNVDGGTLANSSANRNWRLGCGVGSTGVLTIASGVASNNGGALSAGFTNNSVGEVHLQGGTLYMAGTTTFGANAGAVGRAFVTGGDWLQVGALNVGTLAGGTGLVNVANCRSATNITGAMTVGGGSGSLLLTNATFGGGTAVTVTNSGFVVLDGTGSVLRCSTVTVNGGAVTNHVRVLSGGLDITSAGAAAFAATNGSVYLAFDEGPGGGASGDFWGLRWNGNNHAAALATLTSQGALAWGGAASGNVGIYTNASYTFVGYFINNAPVITNAGKSVTINMSEDGAPTAWAAAAFGATDAEGDSLTWTNGSMTPANGTVAAINVTSSNLTSYTYTPNANFNGTNTFTVEVRDGRGGADTCTVTVVVAPINDAPVCTVAPTVSGVFQSGQTVTSDAGVWNDAADTNVNGASILAFTRQWQTATNVAGGGLSAISGATNTDFSITSTETGKYLRIQVTCTDDGVGTPAAQSTITNSTWTLVTEANSLPLITNAAGPLVVTLAEDCGATELQALLNLGATDADPGQQATLSWTNWTVPANGTVTVNGTGPSPATVLYAPATNFNGTNTFTVRVTDTVGGFAEIAVEVHVTAVNDAPTNTAAPGMSGVRLSGNTLTATNGVWSDNADTNASYTAADFASQAEFSYQWWRADNASGLNSNAIVGATAGTYTLTHTDKYKWFSVAVTCTDSNYPSGNNQSNTAYSAWLQETSAVPTVVVFTNTLNDGAWGSYSNWAPDEVPTTNITAVVGNTNVKSPVTAVIGASDTAAAKNLYLGTNANASGTLSMTGGTLTFPAGATVTVASAASSTGTLNQTGGTIGGMTSGALAIGSGANSVGTVILGGASAITSSLTVASAPGASGRFVITNAAVWTTKSGTDAAIGSANNAAGVLEVCASAIADMAGRTLTLGSVASSTGSVVVSGGALTNMASQGLIIGGAGAGYGSLTVTNTGKVYTTSSGGTLKIGGTNNNSLVRIYDSGYVGLGDRTTIGHSDYSSGTLEIDGGTLSLGIQNPPGISIGNGAYAMGTAIVNGGTLVQPAANSRAWWMGAGIGSTGVLTVASGVVSNSAGAFLVGYTNDALAQVHLQGGTLYIGGATTLGANGNAVGQIQITGGNWQQIGALNIGTVAGGTGLVTVANCVSATNITGSMTVGGAGYGVVTISNATFGGGTAVTVTNNGFVVLDGTGSVLRCSTMTVNGSYVTNHIRVAAGGFDVTNSATAALTVTNGGHIHLSFDQNPEPIGDFWGLRWNGNNHAAALQALTNDARLTWSDTGLTPQWRNKVGIYTNSTTTFVGFIYSGPPGSVFTFR